MMRMNDVLQPRVGKEVYIDPTAYVGGDVVLGDQVAVMCQAVIRGDFAPIRIGSRVNIQDGAILHTDDGTPLHLADEVAVGHRAVLHCRRIGTRTLIGIASVLLDDCEIGSRCIVAAGAVVPPGTVIPDGSVVMGVPGRVVRDVGERDLWAIDRAVENYIRVGRLHAEGRYPNIAWS
jgi:carbonic anhydrase/acetyltransferase-like protein (isoleucine patch superfamily)